MCVERGNVRVHVCTGGRVCIRRGKVCVCERECVCVCRWLCMHRYVYICILHTHTFSRAHPRSLAHNTFPLLALGSCTLLLLPPSDAGREREGEGGGSKEGGDVSLSTMLWRCTIIYNVIVIM
jgi:hypothetical protein